jgi:uncharacterized protein
VIGLESGTRTIQSKDTLRPPQPVLRPARPGWILRMQMAEGKFYPLFALLFGWGVALQMERAERRGASFAGRFCRRLVTLLGFGLAHALLLWEGDILVWYAICGFLLLPFQSCQPRTGLIWALGCLALAALMQFGLWALLAGLALIPEMAVELQKAMGQDPEVYREMLADAVAVFGQGSYREIFVARFFNVLHLWMVSGFYVPVFFAMFLLGWYAGKRRLLQELEANLGFFRRVFWGGLIVGVPLNGLYVAGMAVSNLYDLRFLWLLGQAFLVLGGPALSLAYAAGLVLLLRRNFWRNAFRAVAVAGRMPLSNYLLQSLICTTIFYSYGLGLFGAMDRITSLALAGLIYVAQVAFSLWWLKRFQFGPMEWLWRTWTYGRRPQLRLQAPD